MSNYSQVSQFKIEGRFLEFACNDGYKLKYLRLGTAEGEYLVKMAKELRYSLVFSLIPGDWLQVMGEQKFDAKKNTLKFKADNVTKIAANYAEIVQPLVVEKKCTKSKSEGSILICQKSDCWKRGNREVSERLEKELGDRGLTEQVKIKYTGCMKQCKGSPNVIVNKTRYSQIKPQKVAAIIEQHFDCESVLC